MDKSRLLTWSEWLFSHSCAIIYGGALGAMLEHHIDLHISLLLDLVHPLFICFLKVPKSSSTTLLVNV